MSNAETSVSELLQRLKPNARSGSKPRCHWLTHGAAENVATSLTSLIAPWGHVSPNDKWMPQGFRVLDEAQLHIAPRLLDPRICRQLGEWWLPLDRQTARTPNWDIASTCTVEGKPGLLLIEAKAHVEELDHAEAGRKIETKNREEREASHKTIGAAMDSACAELRDETGLDWRISRDSHYQMSNRFAWSWKLTERGIPVILIYLGFLKAEEMEKGGSKSFADHSAWEQVVRSHSAALFPDEVWNRPWAVNGQSFIPLIKSIDQPLHPESTL